MVQRLAAPALLAALLAMPAFAEPEPAEGVEGTVTTRDSPLPQTAVYLYAIARAETQRALTDPQGRFLFSQLPAGVYKLIAFKPGFEPAIVMLSRAAADARQMVDVDLEPSRAATDGEADDYWSLREQIPADVLREIQTAELARWSAPGVLIPGGDGFRTALRAETGVQETAGASAHLTGAGIGMEGRIHGLEVGLSGEYWQLAPGADPGLDGGSLAEGASLAVRMQGSGEGQLDLTTTSRRLAMDGPAAASADFERLRFSWSQPFGDRSRSHFAAQYTSQNNYYHQTGTVPVEVPLASRALNLEGTYQLDVSDRSALETGLRFSSRETTLAPLGGFEAIDQELELFGRGALRVDPRLMVEYGIYTQLVDGSIALAPQGSLVVQLGPRWQATTTASGRVVDDGSRRRLFDTARFSTASAPCQQLDRQCYELVLSRENDELQSLVAVSASHREIAETVQMFFDDNLFRQLESLYLVRGDQLPEVQVAAQRRVTPRILARVESSYAEGGGGLLHSFDSSAYENRVRYFVTSLDTRFQPTSTGVFLAFHQLAQNPRPLDREATAGMEVERLQLVLSQDLNALLRLASAWALHLNFELSRGNSPYALVAADPDEVRQRFTGGVSLRF